MKKTQDFLYPDGWLFVNYFEPTLVNEFTEKVLNHKWAGNYLEIWFHNIMKGIKWESAAGVEHSEIQCCTGKIKKLGISGDSDIFVSLDPVNCPELLGEFNEGELECKLPWADRKDLIPQLLQLKVGDTVQICGYWTRDYGHPKWNQYKTEIHDITDIIPQ